MEFTYHDEFLLVLLEEAAGTVNKSLVAYSGPETLLLTCPEQTDMAVWGSL